MASIDIPVRIIIDAVNNASKKLGDIGGSFTGLEKNGTKVAIGLAAVGTAAGLMGKQLIDAAGFMEQQSAAFEVMLGSAEEAKTMLQDITKFAEQTPFDLPGVIDATKQLLAYGFAQEDVIKTTGMLGDVAAGLKIPLGDIIYLYGTLRAQGRAYTKDLNQFTARGIPILDELAKKFGVTTQEVLKMTEAGKIGFSDVEEVFKNMTASGSQFGGLMEKQMGTTLGKITNFEDSIFRLKAAMGEALLPSVTRLVDALIPLVNQFAEFAKSNPQIVSSLLGVATSLGAVATAGLVLTKVVQGLHAAFALMQGPAIAKGIATALAPLLANPVVLVILAIVAAIALLYLAWKNNFGGIQEKTQAFVDGVKQFLETAKTTIEDFINAVKAIPQQIGDAIGSGVAYVVAKATEMKDGILTAIQSLIAQAPAAIYKFFFEDIPYAVGFAVGAIEKFFTETVPNAITSLQTFLATALLGMLVAFVLWATVDVPNAITSMTIFLTTAIPAAMDSIKAWIAQMVASAIASFISFKDNAIKWTVEAVENVKKWIKQLLVDAEYILKNFPAVVSEFFTKAKDQAIQIAKDMYNGVLGWVDGVINKFKDIVDWAGKAISKAGEAFNAGREAGKRQFGGAVSAASPVIVGEKGPEMFVPSTAGHVVPNNQMGKGGGGFPSLVININAEMIVNSPNERRNLAETLYKELVGVARSQNTTVAKLFGDID